jgi:hypothetical protein
MNSSTCIIETPKKQFISVRSNGGTHVLQESERFSPSKNLLKLLDNAERVHRYQFHTEISFTDLSELSFLDRKLANALSMYLISESPDIPNIVVRLEIIAMDTGHYGPFLKSYVAEEFSIPTEYSFCIIAILNYMNSFKITVEDAICDIFQVSSRKYNFQCYKLLVILILFIKLDQCILARSMYFSQGNVHNEGLGGNV